MEIRLTNPARKLSATVLCLFFALIYCGLISTRYLAEVLAGKANAKSLGLAAHLEHGDADYQFQLGKYFAELQLWPDAANSFREATKLNPYRAEYWLNLAVADGILNRQTFLQDLQRAKAADPNQPENALQAAQILFANGDINGGLKHLRKVLEISPSVSAEALRLAWETSHDIDALLHDTIPPDSAVYSSFLDLLLSRRETVAAAKVWAQMAKLNAPVQPSYILEYVQYLIDHRDPAEANTVWGKQPTSVI